MMNYIQLKLLADELFTEVTQKEYEEAMEEEING